MQDAGPLANDLVRRLAHQGFVLMLDFDGTLAPIVDEHPDARMSERVRLALEELSKRVPLAIVSGRSLEDVRSRVRVRRASYAGSHGLEIKMARPHTHVHVPIPARLIRKFKGARESLKALAKRYPLVSIEDKRTSFALHYRRLPAPERERFLADAHAAVAPLREEGSVRVIDDLSTFDIMPRSGRTKGACVKEMYRILKKNDDAIPVFVGDSETDEDAFRALERGLTIRVGKKKGSAARYFFSDRAEVDRFLLRLARELSP